MGMIKCNRYDSCRICEAFRNLDIPNPWEKDYCDGGPRVLECVRRRYYDLHLRVPEITLLPDGTKLEGEQAELLRKWAEDKGYPG